MPPEMTPSGQMPLVQLIYFSRPFGFDDLALTGILASAARNNTRDGITGALICREDLFMQLLEGPADKVQAAFERIRHDDRHTEVKLVSQPEVAERLFPDWAMRHDPPHSWMWSREDVTARAAEKATPEDFQAIFTRLAQSPPPQAQKCPMGGDAAARA